MVSSSVPAIAASGGRFEAADSGSSLSGARGAWRVGRAGRVVRAAVRRGFASASRSGRSRWLILCSRRANSVAVACETRTCIRGGRQAPRGIGLLCGLQLSGAVLVRPAASAVPRPQSRRPFYLPRLCGRPDGHAGYCLPGEARANARWVNAAPIATWMCSCRSWSQLRCQVAGSALTARPAATRADSAASSAMPRSAPAIGYPARSPKSCAMRPPVSAPNGISPQPSIR